jgi:hypothetical protein
MLRDFDDLKHRMAMDLNGCPWPEKRQALAEAYKELCDKAGVLGETLSVTVVQDQQVYALRNNRRGAVIARLVEVRNPDGQRLPRSAYGGRMGQGRFALVLADDCPVVAGDVLAVDVRHSPTLDDPLDVPDADVLADYAQAIVTGAKSLLHLMAGEAWANPEKGVYEARLFRSLMSDAKSRVETSGTYESRGLHA